MKKGWVNAAILIVVFLLIISLLFVFLATWQVPYVIKEDYKDTEPYTAKECDSVDMLYDISISSNTKMCMQYECARYNQICAQKNFWGNCIKFNQECAEEKCVKYIHNCGLKIDNKEKKSALFKLNLLKYSYDTKTSTSIKTQDLSVSALDSAEIKWDFTSLSTDSFTCHYSLLNTPQMSECHDVIKSKDVTKQKDVIKYCSALNKLFGEC